MDLKLDNLTNIGVSKSAWVFLGVSAAVTGAGLAADFLVHKAKLKKTQEFLDANKETTESIIPIA